MKPTAKLCLALAALAANATPALLLSAHAASSSSAAPEDSRRTGVHGTVRDAAGAPVASAHITLRPAGVLSTTPGRTALSNGSGEYQITEAAGRYTLTVEAPGFAPQTLPVEVSPSGLSEVALRLVLAGVSESVTVSAQGGYLAEATTSATKTPTLLRDLPQSVSVITSDVIRDQSMQSMTDVMHYVPGVTMSQGEGHRDQAVIRGNSTSADFFVDGIRDDVQYLRDLYNVDRVEVLKGSNAMAFGRGGGGGVINRALKQAESTPLRQLSFEGGSFGHKRGVLDLDQPLNARLAGRLNAVYENSDSFRQYTALERYGVNPTMTWNLSPATPVRLSYEYFRDRRVVDRGTPSYNGRPLAGYNTVFFGNPFVSRGQATVHAVNAQLNHSFGSGVQVYDQFHFAHYSKMYQNSFAGAVSANLQTVALSAYNHTLPRDNYFNQTVATLRARTGFARHTLAAGVEEGHQVSPQVRNTGYYNNTATSINVPLSAPTVDTPITFRPGATDANSRSVTTATSVYGQDQVELSRHWLAVVGVRYDRFALSFHNFRDGSDLLRTDNLVSPRAGLVFKPVDQLSIYGNYSKSYLPSAGDQFLTLTVTSQNLKPESFANYEGGVKWDVRRGLSLTSALYRLDRTNTTAPDPNNPALTVQTGSSRTNGFEAGATGRVLSRWQVIGGYGYQNAFYTATTTGAQAGASVPIVPRHTFSLWNNVRLLPVWGVGLGVVSQSALFAGADNTVRLPGWGRVDASTYVTLSERVRLQVNAENLLDRNYFATANSNNNLQPGAPRIFRAALTGRF